MCLRTRWISCAPVEGEGDFWQHLDQAGYELKASNEKAIHNQMKGKMTIGFLKKTNKPEGLINLGVLTARLLGSGALKGTYDHLPQVLQSTGQEGPSAGRLIPETQDSELRAGV